MSLKKQITSRRGFTLIEMLVVITIIALLAGLLFPVVSKAIVNAKRNRAASECRSIASAVELFNREYGYLPVPASDQGFERASGEENNPNYFSPEESLKIIQVLVADPQEYNSGHLLNREQINFLDTDRQLVDGRMLDPWGNQYLIKLDRNYDGKVYYPTGSETHRYNTRSVVVSIGPSRSATTLEDNVANILIDQ
jgi:prepilin-type N-terminal cleavage/methylation domain-containing protein